MGKASGITFCGMLYVGFAGISLIGLSIALLAINRNDLANVTTYCWVNGGWWWNCATYVKGCLASANYNDFTPCNYLYAVGAIGLMFAIIMMCFLPCVGMLGISQTIMGAIHIVWWAVAGWYFTEKYNDAKDYPNYEGNSSRHAVMGICWAALSLGAVQFLLGIGMIAGGRGDGGDDSDHGGKKHRGHEQEHANEMAAHPPPQSAYPPPPPPHQ